MLIGNRDVFAVSYEINVVDNGWVFGCFFLWVNGEVVGDKDDPSVDLRGCKNWMSDVVVNQKDRYEPGLFLMDKNEAYLKLAYPVLHHKNPQGLIKESYKNAYSRFHISHIGMSSFDRFTVLFIKDKNGDERLIYQSDDNDVIDAYFSANEIERVFSEVTQVLGNEIARRERIKALRRKEWNSH